MSFPIGTIAQTCTPWFYDCTIATSPISIHDLLTDMIVNMQIAPSLPDHQTPNTALTVGCTTLTTFANRKVGKEAWDGHGELTN